MRREAGGGRASDGMPQEGTAVGAGAEAPGATTVIAGTAADAATVGWGGEKEAEGSGTRAGRIIATGRGRGTGTEVETGITGKGRPPEMTGIGVGGEHWFSTLTFVITSLRCPYQM